MVDSSQEKTELSDHFSDLFILAAYLKNAKDLGSPESLRHKIIDLLNQADRSTKDSGIPDEVFQQVRYGMVALIDEMILSSPWPYKDQWSGNTLQYEFYHDNIAGIEFYNKLEGIRRALPINTGLLECYYFCLSIGFEGQYKIHGRDKLTQMIDEVGKEILGRKKEKTTLSPHGKRPDELIETVKQGLPAWVVVVSTVGSVVLLYIVLQLMVSHEARSVAAAIQQLGRP
jgi:type VI secretion system protein ImpK